MAIVPKVTMKGAILPRVIISPLKAPAQAPTTTPTRTPSPNASASLWTIGSSAFMARITSAPVKARTEPTERSMPAEMMTKVIPRPIIPV